MLELQGRRFCECAKFGGASAGGRLLLQLMRWDTHTIKNLPCSLQILAEVTGTASMNVFGDARSDAGLT